MERTELTFLVLVFFSALLAAGANQYRSNIRTHGSRGDFDAFNGSGDEDLDGDLGSNDDDDDDDDVGSGGGTRRPWLTVSTRAPDDTISIDKTTMRTDGGVEIGAVGGDEETDSNADRNIMLQPAILAVLIVGGVVIIVLAVLLIMFVVYRMRKKDEGSYILDDPTLMIINGDQHKHSSINYVKAPPNDNEFYA